MRRSIWLVLLAVMAMAWPAAPVMGQRLSERIDHVRQQRARADREAEQAGPQTLRQRLGQVLENVAFEETSVQEAVQTWSQETGVPVVVDWDAMLLDGVDPETPVTLSLRRVSAGRLLSILMQQASPDEELIAEATPWYVEVMTKGQANQRQVMRVYDVMDLLHVVPNFESPSSPGLGQGSGSGTGRGGGGLATGRGSGNRGRGGGNGGGSGLFGSGGGNGTGSGDGRSDVPSRQERAEELMDLVRSSIEPTLWAENGGEHASMRYYNGHLIVSAPNYVHHQIGRPINVRPRSAPPQRRSRPTPAESRRANVWPDAEQVY